MAISTPKTAIKGSAIQIPTKGLESHTSVLRQMKEVIEIGQRLRGDPHDSFVKVGELVTAGLGRIVNGVFQPAKVRGKLVAELSAPINSGQGQRDFVTDATSTTFLAAAVGGGANRVPVVFDGVAWVIG